MRKAHFFKGTAVAMPPSELKQQITILVLHQSNFERGNEETIQGHQVLSSASWKVIPQVLKGYKSSVCYWFIAYYWFPPHIPGPIIGDALSLPLTINYVKIRTCRLSYGGWNRCS